MTRGLLPIPVLARAALFVAVVLALTFDFLNDPLRVISERSWFEDYQLSEVEAVRRTIERTRERGFWNSCGLLHETDTGIYTSQPGLAAFAPAVLLRIVNVPLDGLMRGYAWLTAGFLALAFTSFAFLAGREFGWPAGAAVAVSTALSHPMIAVGRNVWWLFHLCLWPFVVSWWLCPAVLDRRMRKGLFLLVIGMLVFIKALAGYVFITNVILGATVGPLYLGLKKGLPWRRVVGLLIQVTAAGLAGFVLALLVNTAQTTCHYGSLADGVRVIYEKAAARTIGPESSLEDLNRTGDDAAPAGLSVPEVIRALMHVRAMRYALGLWPFEAFLGWFVLGIAMVVLLTAVPLSPGRDGGRGRETKIAGWLLAWSMIGTWTWPLMAFGCTYHHIHLTGLAFHVTYMPVLFAVLGRFASPR